MRIQINVVRVDFSSVSHLGLACGPVTPANRDSKMIEFVEFNIMFPHKLLLILEQPNDMHFNRFRECFDTFAFDKSGIQFGKGSRPIFESRPTS